MIRLSTLGRHSQSANHEFEGVVGLAGLKVFSEVNGAVVHAYESLLEHETGITRVLSQ